MKSKKNRNIAIMVLICMLVFMAIGYAFATTRLNVKGTSKTTGKWDVEIESITARENETNTKTQSITIDSQNKTSANIALTMLQPGDYVEYDVVVTNNGNIPAKLDDILITQTTHENEIKLTHTAETGIVIDTSKQYSFVIKMEFPLTATKVVTNEKLNYLVDLTFKQV